MYSILPDRSDWPEYPLRVTMEKPYGAHGYGSGALFKAEAGLHYMRGNSRPYFYQTSTVYVPGKSDIEAGGCIHDEAVRLFPKLAPIIALHLSDDRGVPMHLEANGLYFLGFGPYAKLNIAHAASHFRITEAEAEDLCQRLMSGSGHNATFYQRWLATQRPRYHREADEAIALLESWTI